MRGRPEMLLARPAILPARHFVYPASADEVERGALEVLVRPAGQNAQPFLATCALGFNDPAVPTGLWSAPNPVEICAVSGGYAYLIDTTAPENFTMIALPSCASGARRHGGQAAALCRASVGDLAWGAGGQVWESKKLSDEGFIVTAVERGLLRGRGWDLLSDEETPFAIDLATGLLVV